MGTKANPYGRLLQVMGNAAKGAVDTGADFLLGEMVTGAQVKVGGLILARDDYLLLIHDPKLKKGDKVLCYQFNDETFIVFGKVV